MNAFKCPGCDTSTWGNLKFCPKCGESLVVTCDGCGYSVRYMMATELSFCPKCGGKMGTKKEVKSKSGQKDKEKKNDR
jgi:rRNA maturation endonuclease Nob1